MRVLGIDPGSTVTGLGVVDSLPRGLKHLDHSELRLGRDALPVRLGAIYAGVSDMISRWQPDAIAVEQIFFSVNAKSALVLGHARGSALCAGVNAGVEVAEYSASQIKAALVGVGRASKSQVGFMVRALLGLDHQPPTDASDALACAICHIHTRQSGLPGRGVAR